MLSPPQLSVVAQVILGVLGAVAAAFDIRFRRIPNWLVLAGIIAGFGSNFITAGWHGFSYAAAGLGLGLALYFPLYLLRARGAGDVKLLAAAGSIAGPGNCLWIFVLTALFGGLIAVIWLLLRGRARQTFFNVGWIVRDLMQFKAPYHSSEELDVTTARGMRLPHAAMIAVGILAFFVVLHYRIGFR